MTCGPSHRHRVVADGDSELEVVVRVTVVLTGAGRDFGART